MPDGTIAKTDKNRFKTDSLKTIIINVLGCMIRAYFNGAITYG